MSPDVARELYRDLRAASDRASARLTRAAARVGDYVPGSQLQRAAARRCSQLGAELLQARSRQLRFLRGLPFQLALQLMQPEVEHDAAAAHG